MKKRSVLIGGASIGLSCFILCSAVAAETTPVESIFMILGTKIPLEPKEGMEIQLSGDMDNRCKYAGRLDKAEETYIDKIDQFLPNAKKIPAKWIIKIEKRTCEKQVDAVSFKIELPKMSDRDFNGYKVADKLKATYTHFN